MTITAVMTGADTRPLAVVTDYDNTLSDNGHLGPVALEALQRWRDSGRLVVLDTGRTLPHLYGPEGILHRSEITLFDRVVAENGAVMWDPVTDRVSVLGAPPSPEFIRRLQRAGVADIAVGWASVHVPRAHAGRVPAAAGDSLRGLHSVLAPDHVIYLREGIDKASGMRAALRELRIDAASVVAVGDGTNDIALLDRARSGCGLTAAVANAPRSVRSVADIVTRGRCAEGVAELLASLDGTGVTRSRIA